MCIYDKFVKCNLFVCYTLPNKRTACSNVVKTCAFDSQRIKVCYDRKKYKTHIRHTKVFTKRLFGPHVFYLSYSDRLKLYSLKTLERRRTRLDLVLLYELICELCHMDLSELII